MQSCTKNIQQGIGTIDDDFESQGRIVEMLDVQLRAAAEDDEQVIYVECRLGQGICQLRNLIVMQSSGTMGIY